MLGALIPVSDALHTTGGTDLIAAWLSHAAVHATTDGGPGFAACRGHGGYAFSSIMPRRFWSWRRLRRALQGRLGYNPDPFLMAVAIGAACDFLTPIGHQCNTLVMGPGGYRFGDYWRLGLPLSLIVIVLGVPLIAFFWPF